jgi:Flp pilus assembly protein TadD
MLNRCTSWRGSWLLLSVLALAASGCSSMPSVPDLSLGLGSASKSKTATTNITYRAQVEQPNVKPANREAFAQALTAIEAQRWSQAEPLLRKVTSDQPGLAGPWVNLAQVYVATEQLEEARLALSQAVKANPNHCAARNQLGVLSRQAGEFSAAEEHYKRCLSVEPDNETVVLNLGILYELYLGRLPEALAAYRQYQDLSDSEDRKVKGWVMDLERRLGV